MSKSRCELDPTSPHAYDTRAHVRHWQGRSNAALGDYRKAMQLGGPRMVKLYQCGLKASGHFIGPVTGIITDQLDLALKECVKSTKCDPLPPDEECKAGHLIAGTHSIRHSGLSCVPAIHCQASAEWTCLAGQGSELVESSGSRDRLPLSLLYSAASE